MHKLSSQLIHILSILLSCTFSCKKILRSPESVLLLSQRYILYFWFCAVICGHYIGHIAHLGYCSQCVFPPIFQTGTKHLRVKLTYDYCKLYSTFISHTFNIKPFTHLGAYMQTIFLKQLQETRCMLRSQLKADCRVLTWLKISTVALN